MGRKDSYHEKVISTARQFLGWLSINWRLRSINDIYLDTIVTPRMTEIPKKPQAHTFEETRAIAAIPVHTLKDERMRASALFLW